MQQYCLECRQTASTQNLFCQRAECRLHALPIILEPGEWIDDLEIVRVVLIGRTATLYDARRNGKLVTLKVAHPHMLCKELLEAEAAFLKAQYTDRLAYLPLLLDPHIRMGVLNQASATAEHEAGYGRVPVAGRLLYFLLFAHIEGEPLRDLTTKRTQLWAYHAAWIVQALAIALHEIHEQRRMHLGLSLESVLIRLDDDQPPQVMLIDCGLLLPERASLDEERCAFIDPVYAAPDLYPKATPTQSADVYSLAVIFSRLLLGALPPRDQQTQSYDIQIPGMERVTELIRAALERRTVTALGFSSQLVEVFGAAPQPKKRRILDGDLLFATVVLLLAGAFLIALVLSIVDLFSS